jgi:hypothetical protein
MFGHGGLSQIEDDEAEETGTAPSSLSAFQLHRISAFTPPWIHRFARPAPFIASAAPNLVNRCTRAKNSCSGSSSLI